MNTYPSLPFGAVIGDDKIWRQTINRAMGPGRRPALFLDRDGVVVEEVDYLHRVEDVRLVDGAAGIIGKANALGLVVVLVTNQAGIGRGRYGWQEFAAVQETILDGLAAEGVFVNAVYACPHHAEGRPPHDVADHPFRKPNPGMLLGAAQDLPIDLGNSWIVGDRAATPALPEGYMF
jgi:D-glycero-D-manno-heptose 1,7-bisphosphate phosphatase